MTGPIVRLTGVTRNYGNERPALADIDLNISAGDYVAIMGRSGSGKSTLLNILGLLDRQDQGRYELLGEDVSERSEAARCALRAHCLGFVFQAFHLINHRTVADNIALGATYLGWTRKRREARAAALIERFGLAHRANALPSTLSGGEKQRVAIARALMGDPQMLLCDEPTGNLDTDNAGNLMALLDSLNVSGITVVVVTHDRDVATAAKRVITLSDGRIVHDGELVTP